MFLGQKGVAKHHKNLVYCFWESQTVKANSPPIDDTEYGNSVSTPQATRTCKTQQSSLEREAHMEFQHRPHIVDTDTIADAVFVDAVSEIRKRKRTPHKRFSKMISPNAMNLENVLLAEPHVAVMFPCRTLTPFRKGIFTNPPNCRT